MCKDLSYKDTTLFMGGGSDCWGYGNGYGSGDGTSCSHGTSFGRASEIDTGLRWRVGDENTTGAGRKDFSGLANNIK